jgi:malate/lactate dehydrogenase
MTALCLAYNLTQLLLRATLPLCSPVRLGRAGVEEFLPLGPMNELEQRNYDTMLPELAASIHKGIDFVARRAAGGASR